MARREHKEVWRCVPSKPGIEASSFGRIRKQPHIGKMPHGGIKHYETSPTSGQVRRAKKGAAHSYRGVHFRGIGNIRVHQAVCEAFHGPKPFPTAVVIHIDENAHNNRPENLKWGTQKENLNMPKVKAWHRSRRGEAHPRYGESA